MSGSPACIRTAVHGSGDDATTHPFPLPARRRHLVAGALPDDLAFELRIMRRTALCIMRSPRLCKATAPKWRCGLHFGHVGLRIIPARTGKRSACRDWIGFCHRFKQPFDKQFFGGPSSSARRHRLFIVGVCSRGHFRLACVLHQSECGVRKTLCPTTPISYLISPQSNYAVWEDVAAELMAATSEFVAP